MDEWVSAVLKGVQSASRDTDVRIRLSLLLGLLQGLEDIDPHHAVSGKRRGRVEDEAVVCCAELFEVLRPMADDFAESSKVEWEAQFKPVAERGTTILLCSRRCAKYPDQRLSLSTLFQIPYRSYRIISYTRSN